MLVKESLILSRNDLRFGRQQSASGENDIYFYASNVEISKDLRLIRRGSLFNNYGAANMPFRLELSDAERLLTRLPGTDENSSIAVQKIFINDISQERIGLFTREFKAVFQSVPDLIQSSDIILLAVKPQQSRMYLINHPLLEPTKTVDISSSGHNHKISGNKNRTDPGGKNDA
jgi:hypothetical protein